MGRKLFYVLIVISLALIIWAFSTKSKDGMFAFFIGAGIFISTLVMFVSREADKNNEKRRTNKLAISTAIIGMVLGGFVGPKTRLGELMISWLNPGLPVREYAVTFGAIGGCLLGAFILAAMTGILGAISSSARIAIRIRRRED